VHLSYTLGIEGLQLEKAKENWMDIIRRDVNDMDTAWEEAEEPTADRTG